jgi:hypothetical protein
MAGLARGMDVSNFAGEFDWAGTSGLSFGICRASQGLGATGTNSPDPFLAWNWPRIKEKGLARGWRCTTPNGISPSRSPWTRPRDRP